MRLDKVRQTQEEELERVIEQAKNEQFPGGEETVNMMM